MKLYQTVSNCIKLYVSVSKSYPWLSNLLTRCLTRQEVDKKAFEEVLEGALGEAGMQGRFLNKAGTVKEGEAIFFRKSKWKEVGKMDLEMRRCFSKESLAPGCSLCPSLSLSPSLDPGPSCSLPHCLCCMHMVPAASHTSFINTSFYLNAPSNRR